MKTFFLYVAIICMVAPLAAAAQQDFVPEDNYNLTVTVTNKKGKPYKGSDVVAFVARTGQSYELPKDGILRIFDINGDDTLRVISSVSSFEIPVSGLDSINIVMRANASIKGFYRNDYDEVVDYGYLTVSRMHDTNPSSTINMNDIGNYRTLLDFLIGRVAGLTVDPERGTATIRGKTSINMSSEPLVVVDGVSMDLRTANATINPRDVESVTVDKMGSLYGVQGANGVIIIRTKRGGK